MVNKIFYNISPGIRFDFYKLFILPFTSYVRGQNYIDNPQKISCNNPTTYILSLFKHYGKSSFVLKLLSRNKLFVETHFSM